MCVLQMLPAMERTRGAGDPPRNGERLPVEQGHVGLPADYFHLGAVRVVGQRLDDIRSGIHELAMQRLDGSRLLEDHLGHVGSGLQVAAALELEHIAFRADHRALCQSLEQAGPLWHRLECGLLPCRWCHLSILGESRSSANHSPAVGKLIRPGWTEG